MGSFGPKKYNFSLFCIFLVKNKKEKNIKIIMVLIFFLYSEDVKASAWPTVSGPPGTAVQLQLKLEIKCQNY